MGQGMRFEDWAERLAMFLDQQHVFEWVTCNCVLFTANAVKVQTGVDYAVEYRHLKTKQGMMRKLVRDYNGDVIKAATDKLGEPIVITMAKRGDVVSAIVDDFSALGICLGKESVFMAEGQGYVYIPTLKCDEAWPI